jgi:phosphate transport system substrate-binding protein
VAQVVRRSEGGIGYVVLAFARPNRLRMASLWNRTGVFVTPSLDTATAAAASSARSMPTDLRTSMVDLEGDLAYPITAFSYMLIPREVDDPARGLALARFAWWAIHQGQSFAPFLAYATLPPDVVAKASARLKEMESGGQRLLAE